jgi:hypothetical protein
MFSISPNISTATGIHKKIDFTLYKSLGTNTYIGIMDELIKCWDAVPNHYDIINFTFTMVGSFQSTTFNKYKSKLLPLIGTCCVLAKHKMTTEEQKQIRAQIHINKVKLGDLYYNEFVNYLRNYSDIKDLILSEEFAKKVCEANMLVALSSNIQ